MNKKAINQSKWELGNIMRVLSFKLPKTKEDLNNIDMKDFKKEIETQVIKKIDEIIEAE